MEEFAYLHVAFPHHFAKFCEMFVNFERIFLYEPCIFFWGFVWQYVLCMQYF